MLLALVIRLVAGYVQSFSNDELSALYRLQFNNFYDFIHWGVKVDGHPALVQLFLYVYTPLCGKSELLIRLPFILASTFSLGFIFFSLKKLSGEFSAYMVVIILALAGFSIELGYFARPYAFGIFFTSVATYYWTKIFIEVDTSKKYWVLFIVASILACYTHYFALLQIGILGMATFFFAPVKTWRKIIVGGIIILITYLPNYPILAFQLSVGGIGGWLGKPNNYFIIDVVLEYFDRNPIIIGCFMLFSMLLVILQPAKPVLKKTLLLLFLSVTPFILLYIYSIKINSLLQFSACFFFMPFLLAAFFSLFESDQPIPAIAKWGFVTCTVIFLGSVLIFNPAFAPSHFGEFKRIANYIKKYESDSVTTIVAVNNPFYIDWYLEDVKPDLYITDMGDDLRFLRRLIDTTQTPEFIYAFTNQRSNAEIPFMIKDEFEYQVNQKFFPNAELYHFSKQENTRYPIDKPIAEFVYYSGNGNFYEVGKDPQAGWKQMGLFSVKDSMQFSKTLEFELKDRNLQVYDRICASITLDSIDTCDHELVISIENGEQVFWRSRKLMHQQGIQLRRQHYIVEDLNHPEIDLNKSKVKVYVLNNRHCEATYHWFRVTVFRGNPYTNGYSQ